MNFINRSENSQVRRTFACDDCDLEWTMWRFRGDETIPECPSCALDNTRKAVSAPPVVGTKSQAMDIAYEAMESMGYTDMKDNQRPGDTAVVPPSEPTAQERHVMSQGAAEMMREWEGANRLNTQPQVPGGFSEAEMARDFFKGSDGKPLDATQSQLVMGGAVGANVARREGRDPMAILHARKPPINLQVVTSDTGVKGPMVVK